jgi:hypothetical protein
MPTNNPKVSAYIPQHIFDCFKVFYEEREISMSQAVAIIFAEYFNVDYQVEHNSKLPSGQILLKLQALEDKVDNFPSLPSELFSKIDSLSEIISSLEDRLKIIEQSNLYSKPLSSLLNQQQPVNPEELVSLRNLPQESAAMQILHDTSQTELFSEPLGSLSIKPISTKLLALRLGVHSATISHTKAKFSRNDFYSWLESKDSDGISWTNANTNSKKYSKGYLPDSGTPPELLSKLQSWLEQNHS